MDAPTPRRANELLIDLRNPRGDLNTDVLRALSSDTRIRILELLAGRIYNVSQLAQELAIPFSTANMHVNALERAGLIFTELRPGTRGHQKVCARVYSTIVVRLTPAFAPDASVVSCSMPIGHFTRCQVEPTCGMLDESGVVATFDDPVSFHEPGRMHAQLLWFHFGFVEYEFPNRLPPTAELESVQLSLELCSEAPLHHPDWPSDISVWINGVELGTWTSPADFGGQRGALTPTWWDAHNSQFGLLKAWQVTSAGSFVDGERLSDVKLADLDVPGRRTVTVRIGVKDAARNRGGINIFGRVFGNHPQDILLNLRYSLPDAVKVERF